MNHHRLGIAPDNRWRPEQERGEHSQKEEAFKFHGKDYSLRLRFDGSINHFAAGRSPPVCGFGRGNEFYLAVRSGLRKPAAKDGMVNRLQNFV
jgi:hypothetical protein